MRAYDGDRALALGASKPRSLLAILLEVADLTGERWYEPELHRLLGVALAEADRSEALACLQRAVELADSQGSTALGDRARESLAQLG